MDRDPLPWYPEDWLLLFLVPLILIAFGLAGLLGVFINWLASLIIG